MVIFLKLITQAGSLVITVILKIFSLYFFITGSLRVSKAL